MTKFDDANNFLALLAAKEARVERQRAQLQHYPYPLLSITPVIPGADKCLPIASKLMAMAKETLNHFLAVQSWPIIYEVYSEPVSGPEWLISVDAPESALKALTISIESHHPIGRLWDIDVINQQGLPISRHAFGYAPRRCLLCEDHAHVCARLRRHSIDALLATIEQRITDYVRDTKTQ